MFTDFHSHILPGIDDGSSSVEESLKLLEIEAEQGIKRVVATPHFYANHDSPERFLERRENAKALLEKALENRIDMPKIEIGAEVHFFRGISDSEFLPELTITNKRFILIEMPDSDWSESMYSELESIYYQRGITPIIAHIDRYISPFRTKKISEKFSKMPVLVQANASFFLEGGLTSRLALKLIKEDKIQLLGSDCHNLTKRPPKLGFAAEVIRKKLGNEFLERIERYGESIFVTE